MEVDDNTRVCDVKSVAKHVVRRTDGVENRPSYGQSRKYKEQREHIITLFLIEYAKNE